MDNDIPEINELIQQFSKLPGLGPKSAKRIILKLINNKDNMVKPLAKSLAQVYKKVVRCADCGNLKIIDKICICSSDNSYDKICVVENLADMWVIDSANIYKGHYHILGGTLNSNENYEKKNLLIESLVKRIKKNNLKEVQEQIKKIEAEGEAGGNLVKVILTGDYELKSIIISDEAKKENQEIINDLIKAAHNNAKENLKKKSAQEFSETISGLPWCYDSQRPEKWPPHFGHR